MQLNINWPFKGNHHQRLQLGQLVAVRYLLLPFLIKFVCLFIAFVCLFVCLHQHLRLGEVRQVEGYYPEKDKLVTGKMSSILVI